jgi:enamine deaminase RidA (YjgF/YER057c/UK114 family)
MNKLHNPETVAAPFSTYSHAVESTQNCHVLYISGQVGVNPDGSMAEGIKAQTEAAFNNVRELLKSASMDFEDITRLNTYLVNREDIAKVRGVREGLLGDGRPASTLVLVAGLASEDWLVEIEAIAAKPWHFYGDGTIYDTRGRPGI